MRGPVSVRGPGCPGLEEVFRNIYILNTVSVPSLHPLHTPVYMPRESPKSGKGQHEDERYALGFTFLKRVKKSEHRMV